MAMSGEVIVPRQWTAAMHKVAVNISKEMSDDKRQQTLFLGALYRGWHQIINEALAKEYGVSPTDDFKD